jgi:dihydroflavonol-4-reductase
MNAFVTGSTGLLGSNLVKQLLGGGHTVKALARSAAKAQQLLGTHPNLTVVVGDLEDIPSFAPQMAGCDLLFHCAAYFREYFGRGDHWPKLKRINVDGTIALLTQAEQQGVQKVIYVSSSAVIGNGAHGGLGDESTPPGAMSVDNLYAKSKVLAEEAISEWLKTHQLPVVLILPTWMYGPQDAAPTGAGQLVLDFLNRNLPAVVPGGSAVVDVRDVAEAMIAAVDKGKSGERYIINNHYQSLAGINQLLAKISNVPAPRIHIPYPAALLLPWLSESAARLRGTETLITVSGIRTMKNGHDVSAAKAKRELGFQPRPFEETLRDTINWYRQFQPEKVGNAS